MTEEKMEANNGGISSVFAFLPEGCISNVISFTSPRDACRASVISSGFKSASESDTVWEKFLPSDYKEIISKSVDPPLNYATKKELFFKLCQSPILIDDGKLSFWLSKSSGKKCYMLCARELSIEWVDYPEHWRWTSIPESRFSKVPEMLKVSKVDIQGKMQTQMLSLKTTYAAYLVFRFTEDSYGYDVAAKASVRFAKGTTSTSDTNTSASSNPVESDFISVCLKPKPSSHGYCGFGRFWNGPRPQPVRLIDVRVPQRRMDGWMEIFLGEFFNDEGEGDIEMYIWEHKFQDWKYGLIVEGIELRPKEDA